MNFYAFNVAILAHLTQMI